MQHETNGLIRFEDYAIDPNRWTIHWRGEPLVLNRKSFDLLLFLIQHRDRVVSKAELLSSLWPGQYVEESNLTQHIFLLRKALARHDTGRKLIENIPGRGYRFAALVEIDAPAALQELAPQQIVVNTTTSITQITIEEEEIEDDAPNPSKLLPAPTGRHWYRSRTLHWSALGAAALAMAAVFFAVRSDSPTPPRVATYTQITTDGRGKTIGGTDGSRLYYTQVEMHGIHEIPVSGGMEAPLQLPIESPWSGDVSPDGSTLLVISQAGGQGPANSLWSFRLVGGAVRRLADSALYSAWSPDGQKIVYSSASGDLIVIHRDGSDPQRIASPGGYLRALAWSPDGRRIRFSKEGLLWEIAPDGSNLHQLLPGWGKSATQWSGEWAPDGRFYFVADGQIWVLDTPRGLRRSATAAPVQLTFGPTLWDRPISSPDSKKIFASGRTRRGELVRFDANSSQSRPFLNGISAEFVSFSNDGRSVAYVTYPDGILWRANADGSHPVQLTEAPIAPKSARWSPDGSQIVYVNRTAEGLDAIYVLASDGSGKPQRILPNDHQAETDPSWSPDGMKIVFSTSNDVGASARSDIHIFNRADGTATVLADSEGLAVPHWSPDGRFISAMTLDTESLRLLNLATQKWSKLDTGAVAFPEWSHDSQWIYYVRWTEDPAILRIRAADGKRETLTDLKGTRYTGSYTLWMALDPNDAPMMLRDEGSDDIYALTLAP